MRRVTSGGDKAYRKSNLGQCFQYETYVTKVTFAKLNVRFRQLRNPHFRLVSFHKNANSSAVSLTSCVIETPELCPAFNS